MTEAVTAYDLLDNAHPHIKDPDWRFKRVKHLVRTYGSQPNKKDDAIVRRFCRFYRRFYTLNDKLNAMHNQGDSGRASNQIRTCCEKVRKLYASMPVEAGAFEVYTKRSFYRYSIESLVLARVDSKTIASKTDLGPDVVDMYEAMFFDVRELLDRNLAIYDKTLSRGIMGGVTVADKDQLWKMLGYHLGSAALVALWDPGSMTPKAEKAIQEMLHASCLRNAALTALIREPNNFNASEVIGDYYASLKSDDALDAESEAEKAAKMLRDVIRVSVATTEQAPDIPVEARDGEPIRRLLEKNLARDGERPVPNNDPITTDEPTLQEQRDASRKRVQVAAKALKGKKKGK